MNSNRMQSTRPEGDNMALPDIDTAGALQAVFEQSPDCIKMLSPSGHLFFMNHNGVVAMEMDSFAEHAGIPWWDVWPEESRAQVIDAVKEAQAGRSSRFTAYRPTAKGTPKWWNIAVSPVIGATGDIEALLVINRDVTDDVRHKEEIEVMSHEMRHRLKNAFAVSAAIAKISANNRPELRDFARDLANRFSSMALTQSRILQSNGTLSLNDLIKEFADTFTATEEAKISWEVVDVDLVENDVRILSMILGELFTNALKHGPLVRGGSLNILGTLDQHQLNITWIEKPHSVEQAETTLGGGTGLVLISRLLGISGGSIKKTEESGTLEYKISLPLRPR